MNYRPYPNADRALAQRERSRLPDCPVCSHPVSRHGIENGHRVCTWGAGQVSCRDCAEAWARTPGAAALAQFGRALAYGGRGRRIVVEAPRRGGKSLLTAAIADEALQAGEHVHTVGPVGIRCAGSGPTCSPLRKNPARTEPDR